MKFQVLLFCPYRAKMPLGIPILQTCCPYRAFTTSQSTNPKISNHIIQNHMSMPYSNLIPQTSYLTPLNGRIQQYFWPQYFFNINRAYLKPFAPALEIIMNIVQGLFLLRGKFQRMRTAYRADRQTSFLQKIFSAHRISLVNERINSC